MVYRIFVEKRPEHANEKRALLSDIKDFLKIDSVEDVRTFNCYDVENITAELFETAKSTVFSEPQLDLIYDELPVKGDAEIVHEYLPGQFDQRADSAAQCIQLISQGDRPVVKTRKVIELFGNPSAEDIAKIKGYVINPVESREANLEKPETLKAEYEIPTEVAVLDGFIDMTDDDIAGFIKQHGLAMDGDDVKCCLDYFRKIGRNPTITEIKILDTYWSDHCRHTTFLTHLTDVEIEDKAVSDAYDSYMSMKAEVAAKKPVCLMDMATIGAKYLKKKGLLDKLDESEEINACTVKMDVETEDGTEKWLLLFKNETHNHPTEIEPFGGAATCIGGAIRDPLSGRSYVYQAMRVTGAADPRKPVEETIKGKLPQRKIVTTAAAGYSSYGNQIGLATGLVDEIYHDGYAAKHLEVGMVVAAAPQENVRREVPAPGDCVILLGGRTGRDGCGGATGSSKSHTLESLETCGAEVQKGNAPEERKLQRLFRDKRATELIKRCNDFGAGGVSVAIGELADGLAIELDSVLKKYDGLDGTELAISESQERMAVVVAACDVDKFINLAQDENLEAVVVAKVTKEPKMVMRWNGNVIVDVDREFLNSNGAAKSMKVKVEKAESFKVKAPATIKEAFEKSVTDLNTCSKQGLSERFDSSIGANTVFMPFGGKYQKTPVQAMVGKIPVLYKETKTCSVSAYGYNPYISEKDRFAGAYLAVTESVSKVVAAGGDRRECYLSFQEYFEKPGNNPSRWGKPLASLLGSVKAQVDFGIGSIGGKDSMSGSFEDLDVPPTLISFAVAKGNLDNVVSPEFKEADSYISLIEPEYDERGIPVPSSQLECFDKVSELISGGKALSVYTPCFGGVAEALVKMTMGNKIGITLDESVTPELLTSYKYGAFVVESKEPCGIVLGKTINEYKLATAEGDICLECVQKAYEDVLEKVYPTQTKDGGSVEAISFKAESRVAPKISCARPKVIIPVFPGTNCEFDTAEAFLRAGAQPEIQVIKNTTSADVAESVKTMAKKINESQIIFIPGGFSGGDEPDGSGKFITAFFRNPEIKESVEKLLENDGLIGGICNGFQALIKLGLVPFGKITDTDDTCPTLTFNNIGRHQSRLVRTRIASNKSPWLANCEVGDVYTEPISHGEGRFVCPENLLRELIANGQIATQYADNNGNPTMDIDFNPNGSVMAIEGITSPDGRVFGKMAHSERYSNGIYRNVDGNKENGMFKSAVEYFKI